MPDLFHPRAGLRFPKRMAATLCLTGAVGMSSCGFHKAPRAFNPPPVTAKARQPIPPAPKIALPPDVAFEPVVYDFPRQTDPRLPVLPPPPPPRAPVANAPKPQPPPSENPPAQAPKLAQILTPEESRRNTQELEQYMERVKRALAMVAAKNLSAEQKDTAKLIQTFLAQAEQAREQDLVTAVNLARRADLLAKDLLERLP
ncbi:MAG: hypothetical protein LAO55_19885 [Acidobacteriia bacterium]|nr:hypothetical protein [Terriglobia bacterium]